MTYLGVACAVLGTGFAAGALAWICRRTFGVEALRRHHEVGSAVFLQLGVIYAVLLAFVFSEVWGEYNTAANAINQECGHLHGAAILASALPRPEREAAEERVATYLKVVLKDEWPAMAEGRRSEAAGAAFASLIRSVAAADPAVRPDNTVRAQFLDALGVAHQWRETRLFQMGLGVPSLLWALLIGLGLVLVGFLLCFGIDYVWSQVIFTAVFAAAVAFVLALVQCLDYPFTGPLRLPPTDFQATLQKVMALRSG